MIIVTGASGQLGHAIATRLLERVPAAQVGLSVRDPDRVADLQEQGVRVRRGDYGDPASLRHAFEGASQVLVISSNSSGDAAVEHHQAAIDAAKDVGAERVVYTSQMASSAHSAFAPMLDHAATELALAESGLAFTSLRNGFYAASGVMLLGGAAATGELIAPEDGPVAWTAHADLAEAAAIVLTTTDHAAAGLDGITPSLTASEAIDLARVAELAADQSGRPVRRIVVSDDDYRERMLSRGLPSTAVEMMMGIFLASRQGEFAQADPTLARLLGRDPLPFTDALAGSVPAPA